MKCRVSSPIFMQVFFKDYLLAIYFIETFVINEKRLCQNLIHASDLLPFTCRCALKPNQKQHSHKILDFYKQCFYHPHYSWQEKDCQVYGHMKQIIVKLAFQLSLFIIPTSNQCENQNINTFLFNDFLLGTYIQCRCLHI